MARQVQYPLLLSVALAAMLGGCATPTPYQPANSSDMRNGYSDYRIEEDRYRVKFSGNSVTSRETVERYLLLRAAQLTVERGFDWFVMADRETERRSQTYVDQPFSSGPYGYWGPAWRYRGAGYGWRSWDPYWGDPLWDRQVDIRTIDRYEATAEIVVGRGAKPRGNGRAFEAREVIANLRETMREPDNF